MLDMKKIKRELKNAESELEDFEDEHISMEKFKFMNEVARAHEQIKQYFSQKLRAFFTDLSKFEIMQKLQTQQEVLLENLIVTSRMCDEAIKGYNGSKRQQL